jgi:hypothetical protein
VASSCEHGNETSGSIKGGKVFERLCSMESDNKQPVCREIDNQNEDNNRCVIPSPPQKGGKKKTSSPSDWCFTAPDAVLKNPF